MKTLKESILGNVGLGEEYAIRQWIDENYEILYFEKFDVFVDDNDIWHVLGKKTSFKANKDITSLNNNGMFVIDECDSFFCSDCKNLTSLEGAPKKCQDIYFIGTLVKNYKGGPSKCKKIVCDNCKNLVSLKGAPKNLAYLSCEACTSLANLGDIKSCSTLSCSDCDDLENLPKNFKSNNILAYRTKLFQKYEYKMVDDRLVDRTKNEQEALFYIDHPHIKKIVF